MFTFAFHVHISFFTFTFHVYFNILCLVSCMHQLFPLQSVFSCWLLSWQHGCIDGMQLHICIYFRSCAYISTCKALQTCVLWLWNSYIVWSVCKGWNKNWVTFCLLGKYIQLLWSAFREMFSWRIPSCVCCLSILTILWRAERCLLGSIIYTLVRLWNNGKTTTVPGWLQTYVGLSTFLCIALYGESYTSYMFSLCMMSPLP